ncbi:hypothetical protein E2C01_010934 [Portunus trituberculatus]|uniref:Uncharacterized protein n=1 Tax=Portunus trituberculatus TaxID=210409 RepID=A0A5B7D9T1_PORTR|nr:hypothetical protein [Portunus trituberculatus]
MHNKYEGREELKSYYSFICFLPSFLPSFLHRNETRTVQPSVTAAGQYFFSRDPVAIWLVSFKHQINKNFCYGKTSSETPENFYFFPFVSPSRPIKCIRGRCRQMYGDGGDSDDDDDDDDDDDGDDGEQ